MKKYFINLFTFIIKKVFLNDNNIIQYKNKKVKYYNKKGRLFPVCQRIYKEPSLATH